LTQGYQLMTTLLVYAPALAHTKAHHPENSARLAVVWPALEKFGVLADVTAVPPTLATQTQLQRIHTPALIEQVRQVSAEGGGLLDHGDTYATANSYDLARLAVGGCCTAIDQVMAGHARNGIALVRPPGHHAESNRVSGFCLFNNIAAAARQAQTVHGAQRILIVDFDVHHGNGTQDIFYQDDTVLFISVHLFGPYFYPGVGASHEMGERNGRGYTVNIPLPPRVGDVGYNRIFDEIIRPKAVAFRPDVILISAGFDAHWQDPLAMAGLSLTGYGRLARTLITLANELCNGRILFVLEGGYQLEVLTYGVLNTIHALVGRDELLDPFGPLPQPEQDVTDLLTQLKRRHLLN
jgi:acetoin utilization deacetylase AcuC-like enzyme